ncbi:synaptotagmin-6-like [Penaeus japonicus]|uniref:synaptotagmin-6-like n=1 Tax=Penaeus japonicus TaxID=27405 RepID=UPI001C70FE99|nr:synaptotagmin-6-like [Penaeus japonicus]
MYALTAWGKVGVMAIGAGVVALAVVLVVCVVGPGCWLNTIFLNDEERRRREKERQSIYRSEAPTLRLTTFTKSPEDGSKSDLTLTHTPSQTPTNTKYTYMSPLHGTHPESSSLLGALSSKRDSTYSSMSEYSGRTSPTNSCRSSVGDSVGSGVGSPVGGEAQGHLSFGIQYIPTGQEGNTGKLVITVIEARGLAGKEYLGNACDPYVKVVLWKERRSLRKHKSPPLHVFRTRTVRHTQDPSFNQSFVVEASKSELKELVVKLVAMDTDKWASPSTVGEVTQPLRDIKNLAALEQRTTLSYFLEPPKLELGEVLFGLSYLPTAQRLSVSVLKANNLQYSNVVDDLKDFCKLIGGLVLWMFYGLIVRNLSVMIIPVIMIITIITITLEKNNNDDTLKMLNSAYFKVEHVTFLLVLCTRPQLPVTPTSSDASIHSGSDVLHDYQSPHDLSLSSSPLHDQQGHKRDRYVGKLALGCNVRGDEQRQHWLAILASPRKVVSLWHSLR